MSLRVGVDVMDARQVGESVGRFGDRYLTRVYTSGELEDCAGGSAAVTHSRLAARFAAKEATLKVLQPDGDVPSWRDIAVRTRRGGRPELELSGDAARLAEAAGVREMALSLTHEGDVCAAVVIAVLGPAQAMEESR